MRSDYDMLCKYLGVSPNSEIRFFFDKKFTTKNFSMIFFVYLTDFFPTWPHKADLSNKLDFIIALHEISPKHWELIE